MNEPTMEGQRETLNFNEVYQSEEEMLELLLQELENLFDKPCLIPVQTPPPG
jgi:hypothetical protein